MTAATGGLTLAVTSSTGVMALAIGRPQDPGSAGRLAAVEVVTDRRHAEEIAPRLQELLDRTGVTLADLDRLVVDIGPGRFTGLRVGLATVRALGFALDIPVIGLTSLAILAAGPRLTAAGPRLTAAGPRLTDAGYVIASTDAAGSGAVTASIDARRNEVFQQTFVDGVPVEGPRVGPPDELASLARGVVIGDGVDRYFDHYSNQAATTGIEPIRGVNPDAMVMIALSRGLPGTSGAEVQPLYLREPDAKPNIKIRAGAEASRTTAGAP